MNSFPLSPFLASLAADGIQISIGDYARIQLALQTGGEWTIFRLRDTLLSLLAYDTEQQELFLRRFDDFFAPNLVIDDLITTLDLQQVLADLQRIESERTNTPIRPQLDSKPIRSYLPDLIKPPKLEFGFWTIWSALLVVGILTVSYFFWPFIQPALPIEPALQAPIPQPISQTRKRTYSDVPYVADIRYEPLATGEAWQRYAGIAALLFFTTLLYGLYLWRSHKIPEDAAPFFDPNGPSHFPLGLIGGQPAPLLNDSILNELADSMGYFQSSDSGHLLNVSLSIQSTMRQGGVPALEYHKRQQLRSLLILEDYFAEPLVWNSLPSELATGMSRFGIPVIYGHFHGSAAQFKTLDGVTHRLEDFEDQRRGYLLLIFSDGKSLYRENDMFALEELAHWPMVAWMELREPRLWDESTMLPARYGIPLYPATAQGTLDAIRHFLTEQGLDSDYTGNQQIRQLAPSMTGVRLDAHIEQLLGDALLWAQDCAMLQPISPGLIDAIRRQFYPHLSADRIQRLYALPDTQHNVAGLHFSAEVLRILRIGFLVRRSETQQVSVLRFLIQEIEKTEPSEKDSLAHLAWESVKERVRLELDQDQALARLAQLAKTPLASAISTSLNGFGFYENDKIAATTQIIPLRLKPNNSHAWQRLARITDDFEIPKLEAFPISLWQKTLFCLLVLLFVGSIGLSIADYVNPLQQAKNWQVASISEVYALLKSRDNSNLEWQVEDVGMLTKLTTTGLKSEKEYQLRLFGGGYRTDYQIPVREHQMSVIMLKSKEIEANCLEEFADIGLTVERCAESGSSENRSVKQPMWRNSVRDREAHQRLLSVGFEIVSTNDDSSELRYLRNLLLSTSSVDLIYRIQVAKDGKFHFDKIVTYIVEELGAQIERSQLIWWRDQEMADWHALENLFTKFDRVLELSDNDDYSWFTELSELFGRDSGGRFVTEEQIREILHNTLPVRIRFPVILLRPIKRVAYIDIPNSSSQINPTVANVPYEIDTLQTSIPFVTDQSLSTTTPFVPTSTPTQLSLNCSFWFHVVDPDLHPVRGARLRVIYKSESIEDLTDSDGDYRGEIPCDIQYPWVNVEISANDFVDTEQTMRLSASRLQIKLSFVSVSTPNPAPTLLPTSSPTPTATPLFDSGTCPFRFQVLDANSAFVFGAQVKVIYRLDSVEGLTDSDGEYQDEIPCDIPNPRVEIEIKLNGSLVLKKNIRLEQKRQPLLITNAATPTPTFTASPTATPITPFDVGDCVKANPRLRLRELPGVRQRLVAVLEKSEVFMILDGPEYSDGYSWWELGSLDQTSRGWAAFIDSDGEKTLILTLCQSPTATLSSPGVPSGDVPIPNQLTPTPTTSQSTAFFAITDPKNGQAVMGKCEVRWRFTGELSQGEGFELILYASDLKDLIKSGSAMDVREIARKLVSHGNGEYSVTVDFSQAPSVKEFGDSSYYLYVTISQIEPYAHFPFTVQSPSVKLLVSPVSIDSCKKG